MATEIIVALIAGSGGLIGSVIGILANTRIVSYRIEQLEKKQDKYNDVIARTYEAEKKIELHCEQLKVANHRISDLEAGGKK